MLEFFVIVPLGYVRFYFLTKFKTFISPLFLRVFVHFASVSILYSKQIISRFQKVRWVALLFKTWRNNRVSELAAAIIKKTNEENPVILDIGANVGLFTKAFMRDENSKEKSLQLNHRFMCFLFC